MIIKAEAEKKVRHLCHVWAKEKGFDPSAYATMEFQPSFGEFTNWLELKGYSYILQFRSGRHRRSSYEVAQHWFDQEFKQTWRN